jgi:hypothetical protein
MRHYPLMKRTGQFTGKKALELMVDITLLDAPFVETLPAQMSEPERLHLQQSVYTTLDAQLVHSQTDFERWTEFARDFILAYDALFEAIRSKFSVDIQELEARAYVLNEDRLYFLPAFTPTYLLALHAKNLSPQQMDARIQDLIFAGKRTPIRDNNGFISTDIRLFQQGTFCWQLDGVGACYPVFRFQYDGLVTLPKIKPATSYCLKIDGIDVPATVIEQTENTLVIRGEKVPTTHLLAHAYREKHPILV